MNLRKLTAVLALSALAACSKGSPTAPSDIESAPSVSAQEASPVTASSEIWLSTEDRIWFKSHVPKFSVEGTVVSVSGTNRWDVQVRQGSAQEFFLKIFDKQDPSQPFIGQAGPFKIGAKESFSASVDIGFGYCFVEAELRLDTADNKVNGGTPSYLFGAENLDIPGCKKPSTPRPSPSPDPTCEELENCPPPPVDYCLNIEGQQDEVPQGYVRDEAGNCTLIPPPCEEIWTAQEPEVTYGEYGECGPIL
ncbi:MAG: hypothetical protein ACRD2L_02955, partial [Terriglobia bacterium]